MKLHILSDLHTEFADFDLPETDADVIVLAGDIGVGTGGLDWLSRQRRGSPVIYVPGNHGFYRHDLSLLDELRSRAPRDVHVLDNEAVVLGEVRFLGSTLWTDFELFGDWRVYSRIYSKHDLLLSHCITNLNTILSSPNWKQTWRRSSSAFATWRPVAN